MVYFSSDFHLCHKSILKYRTQFKTTEEHDEYFLQKMEKLGKRDVLFILGDFIFDGDNYDKYIKRIRKMKCRIKLIMGNHDSLKLYQEINQKPQSPEGTIEIQLPLFSYKNMWISHCPIHPNELRNRLGNIHGHLHQSVLDDDKYFDVCPEKHNFEFVTLDDIKEHFK